MRWPWQKADAERDDRQRAGAWGEKEAARMLSRKGYRILGRRVRLGPREELDVVARAGDVLVFVEVKTRRAEDFGRPASAVRSDKRRAQSRAAMKYLRRLKGKPPFFRFDVVEVIGSEAAGEPEVRHIENAFTLAPRYRVPW